MVPHPYPVGTPCIIISSKIEELIGKYCEVVRPLDYYYIKELGKSSVIKFGYGILVDDLDYFSEMNKILAIKPDDNIKEEEEWVEDEQCVIVR